MIYETIKPELSNERVKWKIIFTFPSESRKTAEANYKLNAHYHIK